MKSDIIFFFLCTPIAVGQRPPPMAGESGHGEWFGTETSSGLFCRWYQKSPHDNREYQCFLGKYS